MKSVAYLRGLLPGIAVCIAITVAAMLLQAIEVHFAGHPYLEAMVMAILLGVAVRTPGSPRRCGAGHRLLREFVLEVAIAMLGASVSFSTSGAWPGSIFASPPSFRWRSG